MRIRIVAITVGVVLIALVGVFAVSFGASEGEKESALIDTAAPQITSQDTEGRTFSLSDYRGTWVLLNFFQTTCIPCINEHPQLVEFQRRHELLGDGTVVSVAFQEEPARIAEFFATNGGTWAIVDDTDSKIALDYGVIALPESFLIDPTGIVRHKFIGEVSVSEVEAEMTRSGGE